MLYTQKKTFSRSNKVRDHCHYTGKYRGATHNIRNLRYKRPTEIPVILDNGSNYDYYKDLAKDFKGQFECLGENIEKYINFLVPREKERKNNTWDKTYR